MEHNDFDIYGEMLRIERNITIDGERNDFISFLRYCAERLDKGDSVQVIWNDYLDSKQ